MSAARAAAAGVLPVTSIVPPRPIAPGLRDQVEALAAEIAEHDEQIGKLTLAEMQGEAGATERLAELETTIAGQRAEHAKKTAAWKAALVSDRAALEAHRLWIRSLPPETLIAGITAKKCCDLCHENGCAIGGGIIPCMHPRQGVPPALSTDQFIARTRSAAHAEIRRRAEADENAEWDGTAQRRAKGANRA
jgi:hypothetical protein